MLSIQDIYNQYDIPPHLQLHTLRVAAVAIIITQHNTLDINKEAIIGACLLHDMGNIVKYDMHLYPEVWEPEGIIYWTNKQQEMIQNWGTTEHEATSNILQKIQPNPTIQSILDEILNMDLEMLSQDGTWEAKIVDYADLRVGPQGVLSLQERLNDFTKRICKNHNISPREAAKNITSRNPYFQLIEIQIFTHSDIQPEDITHTVVTPLLEELRKFPIHK